MNDKYILDGHKPVLADFMTWAKWFDNIDDRRVAKTDFDGGYVSTVFLGIDHRFGLSGDPILFETMIFGGHEDGYQERYCTWEEAEEGHQKAVALTQEEARSDRESTSETPSSESQDREGSARDRGGER